MAYTLHWHHGMTHLTPVGLLHLPPMPGLIVSTAAFLSLKKHIFGKCPTLEQILHLCLLAGHLKLSLCLKSPYHVQ